MTGKADDASTGGIGRTQSRPTAARGRLGRSHASWVPIDVGPAPAIPDPTFERAAERQAAAVAGPTPPDVRHRKLRTQASYRQLVSSGLTSVEAEGLIGYASGLPANASPWTMYQINTLLFLQALYVDSQWGEFERRAEG